jgi:2-polyprenyl-3-methyl-5-hydroxy-6-metoxy-1,4-benzoquinol methylase
MELNPDPAAEARLSASYDGVLVGAYPEVLSREKTMFDCIVFNDVLEHMTDPWSAVGATPSHHSSGGVVIASIPNVRYIPIFRDLVLRGRWQYTDVGAGPYSPSVLHSRQHPRVL